MLIDFDDPGAVERPGAFDFGSILGGVIKTGADLGKTYLQGTPAPTPQQQTQAQATQAQATAAQSGWMKWAIIGGAVVALVAVLGLVFKR